MPFDFSRWSLSGLFGSKDRRRLGQQEKHYRVVNPFHAVTIVPGPRCCRAVKGYTDRRYLSVEAPTLPVTGCDAHQCTCRYVHHDDRRVEDSRRAADLGIISMEGTWRGVDRRRTRGRRSTD